MADGEDAFCIKPGYSLYTDDYLTKDASKAWNALSSNRSSAVKIALLYGLPGNSGGLS